MEIGEVEVEFRLAVRRVERRADSGGGDGEEGSRQLRAVGMDDGDTVAGADPE